MNRTQKVILLIIAIIIAFFIGVGLTCIVLSGPIEVTDLIGGSSGPSVEPSREEWALASRGDGKYRIGNQREMALGRWYTDSNKYGCSWEILSRFGDVIERGSGKTVMISGDTYDGSQEWFETKGCGTWYHQYGK